jgi:uncharacterized membrane protein YfcA
MVGVLKILLYGMTFPFSVYFLADVYRRRKDLSPAPWSWLLGTGFVTNMFDALGVGSFAQQTAISKFLKLVDDRVIPGTMNVGNTIPTVTQALIFMSVVDVSPVTLASMSAAAPAGAVLGAGVVSRMSRRRIQLGLGFGLLAVAKAAFALTLFGIAGVLLAAFVVKSLPLDVMKWVVLDVVLYTSAVMFLSARRPQQKDPAPVGP